MQEADEMISLAIRSVRMQGELLKPAADRNDRKWNIYGNKFHSYLHKQVSVELDSYDAHIDFLCNWIETRWRWMTKEIQTRIDARTS